MVNRFLLISVMSGCFIRAESDDILLSLKLTDKEKLVQEGVYRVSKRGVVVERESGDAQVTVRQKNEKKDAHGQKVTAQIKPFGVPINIVAPKTKEQEDEEKKNPPFYPNTFCKDKLTPVMVAHLVGAVGTALCGYAKNDEGRFGAGMSSLFAILLRLHGFDKGNEPLGALLAWGSSLWGAEWVNKVAGCTLSRPFAACAFVAVPLAAADWVYHHKSMCPCKVAH